MHVVIDTDTAADEILALLLLLLTSGIDLHGISVVCGNVNFDRQLENALRALELAGRVGEVGVFPGARHPLVRDWADAEEVWGDDGLGGAHLAAPAGRVEAVSAVPFLLEASRAYAGDLVVIAQGPLTNLALAQSEDPDFAGRLKALWVMGGTNNAAGNVDPLSEYNFYVDPEAARIVFQAGFPLIRLATWDLTLQDAVMSEADLERIAAIDTDLARFFLVSHQGLLKFNRGVGIQGTTHPDSLTVAMAIDETLWTKGFPAFVDIETRGELTRGASVVDTIGAWRRSPNAWICTKADGDRFRSIVFAMLAKGTTDLALRRRDWVLPPA